MKNKGISGRAFGIIFLIVGLLVGIGGTFAVAKSLSDQKKMHGNDYRLPRPL